MIFSMLVTSTVEAQTLGNGQTTETLAIASPEFEDTVGDGVDGGGEKGAPAPAPLEEAGGGAKAGEGSDDSSPADSPDTTEGGETEEPASGETGPSLGNGNGGGNPDQLADDPNGDGDDGAEGPEQPDDEPGNGDDEAGGSAPQGDEPDGGDDEAENPDPQDGEPGDGDDGAEGPEQPDDETGDGDDEAENPDPQDGESGEGEGNEGEGSDPQGDEPGDGEDDEEAKPSLSVSVEAGDYDPTSDVQSFSITVTNSGTAIASDVNLSITSDPQLEAAQFSATEISLGDINFASGDNTKSQSVSVSNPWGSEASALTLIATVAGSGESGQATAESPAEEPLMMMSPLGCDSGSRCVGPDTSLEVTVDIDGSECGPITFDIFVENTGERSDATNVLVKIEITKGQAYVSSTSPSPDQEGDLILNFGKIAPGGEEKQSVTINTNDDWNDAAADEEIKLKATVINEDSRPSHTENRHDNATAEQPGNCDGSSPLGPSLSADGCLNNNHQWTLTNNSLTWLKFRYNVSYDNGDTWTTSEWDTLNPSFPQIHSSQFTTDPAAQILIIEYQFLIPFVGWGQTHSLSPRSVGSCILQPASLTVDQTCDWNGETSLVDVTFSGLTGVASITWNNGTTSTYTPDSTEWDTQNNKLTISDVDPGNYSYSWTSAEGYTGGGSDISIDLLSCQPASLTVDQTCDWNGETSLVDVTFSGLTGVASITWNNGTTSTYTPDSTEWDTQNNKLTISDVDPGNYSYSWTSAEGYTGGGSDISIDLLSCQPASLTVDQTCDWNGETSLVDVTFSGLAGVASITWNNNTTPYTPDSAEWDTTNDTLTLSDVTPGNYSYSWTSAEGYTGGGSDISIDLISCIPAAVTVDQTCDWSGGTSLVDVTFTGLTGVASITWNNGTTSTYTPDSTEWDTQNNKLTISDVDPGNYSYSWTSAEGYTGGESDVSIDLLSCQPASVTVDQTCDWNGETSLVDVTFTGLTGVASITWNNGTPYTPNSSEWVGTTLTISDVAPGNYSYSWTSAEGYTGGGSDISIKVLSCQPLTLSVTCLADGDHLWTVTNPNNYAIDIEWEALSRDKTETFSESDLPVTVPSGGFIKVQTTPKSQLFRVTYDFVDASRSVSVGETVEKYADACVLEPIVDYNCRDFDNSHMWSIKNKNIFDILVQWRFNDDSFTDSWVTIAAGATHELPASSSDLQTLHVQYRYADETIYNASPVTAEECKAEGIYELSFVCGYPSDTQLFWQVENPFDREITFTWKVEGSSETGTETISALGSLTFNTSLGDKNVIIYVNGNEVDQAESGEACYEDLELDFECLITGLHEWTVTNNNDFEQSFDWSSTNGESDDNLTVKAHESITFTTGLELQTVTVSYEHEIFEKTVETLAEACKSPELDLVYDCGYPTDSVLYWYVSNPLDVDIDFTWEVLGVTEKGSGTASANADTYFTTSTGLKSVKILVEGYEIDMEDGGESCMVELSISFNCLDNGTQQWTVTNLNKDAQPFDWSSDSGASGSGVAPAGGSYKFTTANIKQEITIEYKHDPFPAQSDVAKGEVCKLSTPEPPTTTYGYSSASDIGTCQEWIVFHTMRDGNMEVYRMDGIEGVGDFELFNLSKGDEIDARPSRSFNDAWVAFQSNRDGNYEIYYGDTAGSHQYRLTDNEADDINPMFSPDNVHIVFQSDRNGNWDLYMVNRVTGVETQLTDAESDETNPFFSNNQNFLVFETNKNGNQDIYLLNIVTGDEYKVATSEVDEVSPALSPNGQKVAFLSPVEGVMQLFVVNIDGSNKIQITDGDGDTNHHAWSPDSTRLAYQSVRDDNLDIYSYDLRDNTEYRVTEDEVDDIGPTWDCGGVNLSFTTTSPSGDLNIYQVYWKGGTSSQMTIDPAADQWSEWSPAKETASRDD